VIGCISPQWRGIDDMKHSGNSMVLVGAMLLATACGDKQGDNTMAGDSATMAAGNSAAATPSAAPAPAAPAALTDPNIAYVISMANKGEIERGDIASTKGTSAEVRNYGKMITGEHKALETQVQALAKKLNVTPAMPAGDQSEMMARQQMDTFNSTAKGAAWDKAYIDYEVTYHQGLMETAKAAIAAAQNAELKSLLESAAPVVQKHIDMAQAIQKKMGGM
jgi:putative membrane protein